MLKVFTKEHRADPQLVKTGWSIMILVKTLDQEYEGTHPEIGWMYWKYKLNEKLIDMIENHHGDQFSISLEAAIVQVADAISSVRLSKKKYWRLY